MHHGKSALFIVVSFQKTLELSPLTHIR